MTLEIVGIIILILLATLVLMTYFIKKQHYKRIDELDGRKSSVMDRSPIQKLQTVNNMSITGQSKEAAKKLSEQWEEIETKKYPRIENCLFEAEQATDRYKFRAARVQQEEAEELMNEMDETLNQLIQSLDELTQREEANLKKIDDIKRRYHEIRKNLLAKSFSFGRAIDTLENNLGVMENDFREFSDLTASGDHEEAKMVILRLDENISTMEKQMDEIPALLENVEQVFEEQIDEIESGYEQLIKEEYVFSDQSITEELNHLRDKVEQMHDSIGKLELEKVKNSIEEVEEKIEFLYDSLEKEIEAKPEVEKSVSDQRKALHYLKEQIRRLFLELDRIAQSYILNNEEQERAETLRTKVDECQERFDEITAGLNNHELPFSEALNQLDQLFDTLEEINEQKESITDQLYGYREQELEIKEDVDEMEQAMREMKRYIESKHLPGLPQKYLDFFFYASDHIESLSKELARPKLDMNEVKELHKMCEEDVDQLAEQTELLVDNALLTELVSQRLHRHKKEHQEVAETVRYSHSLFTEDYDYETALKMVREKLESIEPDAFDELEKQYQNQKTYE